MGLTISVWDDASDLPHWAKGETRFSRFWEIQVTTKWQLCFIMNKHILHLQVVIFGVDTARSGAGYLFKDTLKKMQKLMKKHFA